MSQVLSRRRVQARGRLTRSRILRAAGQLFARNGFAEISVADISERAGVSVGSVYHHFSDKRAMLLDLIDDWGDRVEDQRRNELDLESFLGDAPRAAIRSWLRRSYERLRKQPSLYPVVLAMAGADAEVRRRYQRIEEVSIRRVSDVIRVGQKRGQMRSDLDAESAAFLIHHAIDMAATQLLVREISRPEPDQVLEELTDMICRYVLEETK